VGDVRNLLALPFEVHVSVVLVGQVVAVDDGVVNLAASKAQGRRHHLGWFWF